MRTALLTVSLVTMLATPGIAAEQTWTGQISDSMCGAKHAVADHGKQMSDRECA